jgi:hypothetical protein
VRVLVCEKIKNPQKPIPIPIATPTPIEICRQRGAACPSGWVVAVGKNLKRAKEFARDLLIKIFDIPYSVVAFFPRNLHHFKLETRYAQTVQFA